MHAGEDTDYQSSLRFKEFKEKAEEDKGKSTKQSGNP